MGRHVGIGNLVKLHELLNLRSARNGETRRRRGKTTTCEKFGGAKLFNDSYTGMKEGRSRF